MNFDWIKRVLYFLIFISCVWICMELFRRDIPVAGLLLTGFGFVMLKFVGEVEEYTLALRSDLSQLASRLQSQEQDMLHMQQQRRVD
ncbi:hypothetical protein ACX1C1_09055 [Paenibacillus sp. strain BS8-2]